MEEDGEMYDGARAEFPLSFGKQSKSQTPLETIHNATRRSVPNSKTANDFPSISSSSKQWLQSVRSSKNPTLPPPPPSPPLHDEAPLVGPPPPPPHNEEEEEEDDGDMIGPPPPPPGSNLDDSDSDEDSDQDQLGNQFRIPLSNEIVLKGHTKVVSALAVDHSGSRVLSGSYDYMVRMYDFQGMSSRLQSFRQLEPSEGHQIRNLSWSPTADRFLCVTGSAQAKIYDRDGLTLGEFIKGDMYIRDLKNTKGHITGLTCGEWHPRNKETILTSSEDGSLRIWDVNDFTSQKQVIKPKLARPGRVPVTTCAWDHDGKCIGGGIGDGSIQIWSIKPGWGSRPDIHIEKCHEDDITSLKFSTDGRILLSRSFDDSLKVWDLRKTKEALKVFKELPNHYGQTNVGFSPDEQLFFTGTSLERDSSTGGLLCFFDRVNLELVSKVGISPTSSVVQCSWHPKLNQIFATVGDKSQGGTHILYDPTISERGALVCVARAPRKKSIDDFEANPVEPAKLYKLKHLSKVEVLTNDPSGCTFTLGFDNLRSQSVAPPQWTMRNIDDRNRLLLCILTMCKDVLGRLPKVVGIDVVEMALWAKENRAPVATQSNVQDGGPVASIMTERELKVNVEKDLVSQAEEEDMEDMEALLGTYVMGVGEAEEFSERLKRELQALEAANVHAILESEPLINEVLYGLEAATNCVEDMDEWLGTFNVKLRHMREDIASIETRNNSLQMQSVNNKSLIEELDTLLERLRVPSEYAACLTGGSFDEDRMLQNVEACEWLTSALRGLEVPNIDPTYANMKAVKEKRAELEKLKSTFVRRASEFLRNYFASLVDFMISDKSYFSQRGQLKRPDHADLRYKCRTYARLLQHLKSLDKNCLGPLRKAYCSSLNLLLRREAREFANELRASTKASRNPTVWLEGSTGSGQNVNATDTSTVSDAYAKMLTIFIPLLVDESSFFAHFMCFEVPTLVPPGGVVNGNKAGYDDDDDLGIMDIDENDSKSGKNSAELAALNESLQDLLDGIQEDFYAVVDWAYKIDPLRCISMHGITERYLSGQKADAAGFVRLLLGDLESRISMQFSRFVDEACHQIERNERNVRQIGVLSYIPRFATLATRMEQYIQGQSRDLVDQAYTKFVSVMFATLEKISQTDPKYADIFLFENYAAFQNSLYDLANIVPTLAKFYHQASEAYEQACTRHISMIIYIQFERLFLFARRIEDLMFTVAPEEIPFQLGLSKMDLRKMLKSSLSGVDKSINAMYKKLQKNLTSEELLPSLWDKCKKEFLDKYESFAQLVAKIYPNETIPSVAEMKDLLGNS